MRRLLILALLLASPVAFATAPAPIYCIAASLTDCSSTAQVGNGTQGDIWWKAFGKFNDLGDQLGIFSSQPANEVIGTGPSGGLPSLESLSSAGIAAFTGTITPGDCAKWSAAGILEDAGACGGGSGTVTDGTGTTTANELLLSSTTAHAYTNATTLPTSALPALTGDVTSPAGSNSVTVSKVNGLAVPASAALLGTNVSGQLSALTVLPTSAMPALTGDVVGSAGSLSLAVTKVNGGAIPASAPCLGTNSSSQFTSASCVSVTLQTGGVNNTSQTTLNLVGVGNVGVTNPSGGTVDIGPVTEPIGNSGAQITSLPFTTFGTSDCGTLLVVNASAGGALDIPQANGSYATCQFDVTNLGAGTATLTPTTSTINGKATLAVAQNRQCSIISDGTNWQVIGCNALVSSSAGFTLENGGTSLGTVTTLNCSTGTTCSASGGVGTLTASASSSEESIGFANASLGQGTTNFVVPGDSGAGAGIGAIATRNGTLQHLYVRATTAPASGQTYTATLYLGTPGSMTSTAVTCTITSTSPNNLCSDVTDTAAITAGQAWAIQIVTSATSGSTGILALGIGLQ